MFIRAFIYSNSKDEAQNIFESIIESVKDSIKNKEYIIINVKIVSFFIDKFLSKIIKSPIIKKNIFIS